MPSAPQKPARANGRSIETLRTVVPSRPAASSLNFRTLAWQTPVPMLGKMLRTVVPVRSAELSSARSAPTRVKDGALVPSAGRSPTVFAVESPNAMVAMAPFLQDVLQGLAAGQPAELVGGHELDHPVRVREIPECSDDRCSRHRGPSERSGCRRPARSS